MTEQRLKEIVQESIQKILSESLGNLGEGFKQVSGESLKPYLNEVWAILQNSYVDIGGFLTYKNEKELLSKASLVTLHFLGNNVDVCAVYTAYLGGQKLVGCGTKNKTSDEKDMLKKIIKDDIDDYSQWHWAEVSPPLEYWFKKLGGTMIPNIYTSGLLNKKIEFGNDGYHYIRAIGKDQVQVEKVIYG